MRQLIKQYENKKGFTIVEILTVMSIIIILIGILVPSLNMVRRYAIDVKQRAQFHGIDAAMELYKNEFEGYPDSSSAGYPPDYDEADEHYPGAARLCEAMVGQDLLGFHPESHFRADCTDGTYQLYANPPGSALEPDEIPNLQARVGPYLPLDKANAYRLDDIYDETLLSGDDFSYPKLFVLCDEYARVKNKNTGRRIGMPVLYYKANPAGQLHDPNTTFEPSGTDDKGQFYNYLDNNHLVELGMPWSTSAVHPLADPEIFYGDNYIRDKRIEAVSRPYRSDSYILISAGFDGQYGTSDDIFNFRPIF
jgi:type II secretory pathway pseudopilin PulG